MHRNRHQDRSRGQDENGRFDAIKIYASGDYEAGEPVDPGTALVARARQFAADHPGVKFREALNAVTQSAEGAGMLRAYNENAHHRTQRPRTPDRRPDRRLAALEASEEIDRRARQYSEAHETDYRTAVRQVLSQDGELAAAWAGRKSA